MLIHVHSGNRLHLIPACWHFHKDPSLIETPGLNLGAGSQPQEWGRLAEFIRPFQIVPILCALNKDGSRGRGFLCHSLLQKNNNNKKNTAPSQPWLLHNASARKEPSICRAIKPQWINPSRRCFISASFWLAAFLPAWVRHHHKCPDARVDEFSPIRLNWKTSSAVPFGSRSKSAYGWWN